MALITFVRHGQASWGADNYDQLSIKGAEQARVLGKVLMIKLNPSILHGVEKWLGTMKPHNIV